MTVNGGASLVASADNGTQYYDAVLSDAQAVSGIPFSGDTDAFLEVYTYDSNGFNLVTRVDEDSLSFGGESHLFSLSAGEYYLLAAAYASSSDPQTLQISDVSNAPSRNAVLDGAKAINALPYEEVFTVTKENLYSKPQIM